MYQNLQLFSTFFINLILLFLTFCEVRNFSKAVKPTLEETEFIEGAKAKLRFGPPEDGVKEIEFEI